LQAGDRFMLQNYFASATELDISRQMGSGFSEVVMELEPGQWHGPVLSGYGVHLVYVHDYVAPPPAVLEDVQARVLEDWHAEKREQFNADFLEGLKRRYEIVIDELPAERLLEAQIEAAEEDAGEVEPVAQVDTKS
jgi:parvulin-like peptidyl-prolyl isomerase